MTTINGSKTSVSRFGMTALAAAILSVGFASQAYAFTNITSQLDLGESNADVTSLQEFLAASPAIYPSGLVTGYFGALTRSGVIGFQSQYGLDQVGRVGPLTRDKINYVMNNGQVVTAPATSPIVSLQYAPQIGSTSAIFTWMTSNTVAYGRMYYSTSPLQMNEGDINSVGFAVTTGQLASYDGIARSYQSASLTGLQSNTTYYYVIVATDLSGNVSVIGPNNTFRTN